MTTPTDLYVRYPVAAPVAAPRPFGLFSVAEPGAGSPASTPEPWERGVDYYSPNCNLVTKSLDNWCPAVGDAKEFTPFTPMRVEGVPFTVTSGTVCTSPTFDAEGEALAQLERGEQFRAEDRFWAGQMARPDLDTRPKAPSLACALGALEGFATLRYGARPVLHVPIVAIPLLFEAHLLVRNGDRLETGWGVPVVAGAGYPIGIPTPTGITTTLLITGTVTMWRTEPFVNSDIGVHNNERFAIAERTYVITADCLAVAVPIDICTVPAPGPTAPDNPPR